MKKPIVNVNDIIKITSSDILFNDIFLITKIQDNEVSIKSRLYEHVLIIDGDKVSNSTITSLEIISGIGAQGYANYNKLNLNETVTVEFNNSTDNLTGKIINISDDVITIKPVILSENTLQSKENIVIDFAYNGLPDNIKSINIIGKPIENILEPEPVNQVLGENEEAGEDYDNYVDADADKLHEILNSANIIFGDLIGHDETITVEVSDVSRRYDIDKQVNDMLDGMFAYIRPDERDSTAISKINKTILRFKQLRDTFSEFDTDGIINSAIKHSIGYKPSVNVIKNLNKRLYWVLPNVTNTKRVYPDTFSDDDSLMMKVSDTTESVIETEVKQFNMIADRFAKSSIDLNEMLNGINEFTCPFSQPHSNERVISSNTVKSDLLCIVDNISGIQSSVYARNMSKGGQNKPSFLKNMAVQIYNTGITRPRVNKVGVNIHVTIEPITESDFASITSITMLPLTEGVLNFSRINLKSLNILDRVNMNKHFINMWKVLDTYIETDVDDNTNISYNNVNVFKVPENSNIYANTPTGYELFLNRIIPSIEEMINTIKPNISGALTQNAYIDALEALMIYNTDINLEQYTEIQKLLQHKIDSYKSQFTSRSVKSNYIQHNKQITPLLLHLLSESDKSIIITAYELPKGIYDMMVWNKILSLDGGVIYNFVITRINMHLNRGSNSDSTDNKSNQNKLSPIITPISPQYYPFTPTDIQPIELKGSPYYQRDPTDIPQESGKSIYNPVESHKFYSGQPHIDTDKQPIKLKSSPQYYPYTPTDVIPNIEHQEIVSDPHNKGNLSNTGLTHTVINMRLNKTIKLATRLQYVKKLIEHKYEYQKFSLAKSSNDDKYAKSPFTKIMNDILNNNDIYTASTDLLRFVDLYTREADLKKGENNYWLYCNVTGVTLIPTFKVTLASAVISNTYITALAQVCSRQGKSDNGLIVDEFTGWTIRHMDEGSDDKYNADGFLLKTGEVLEQDEINPTSDENKLPVSIYNNKIKTVISSMSNKLAINISESEEKYIIDGVDSMAGDAKYMMTLEDWENESKQSGKAILPFNDSVNLIIICITLSFFIISIQTSTPAVISNVSISNCVNSFAGYPVFSSDPKSNSGLAFISCVANSIGINSKHSLWKSIGSTKTIRILKMITTYLNDIIKTHSFENKISEFNKTKDAQILTEKHMIGWTNFMPPLNTFKPTQSNTINDKWEKDLFTKSDDTGKYSATLSAIYSKMIEFGLNIVGIINETVDKERIVTASTNKVETTCCIDITANTLDFFTKSDNRIKIINANASRLSDLLAKNRNIDKSNILCITSTIPEIITQVKDRIVRQFSIETIYEMYKKQCNFDNNIAIPIKLRSICQSKPDIDYSETLSDIIMKLQTSGFKFNTTSMNRLLNVIAVVRETTQERVSTQADNLRSILTENSDILHIDFIEKFMGFINAETPEMIEVHKNKLINFLLVEISLKWKKITNVLKEHPSSMKLKEKNTLFEFMEKTFINPKIQNDDDYGFKYIEYIKKCVKNVTNKFPNMILSGGKNRVKPFIPKHWKITSGAHHRDLNAIFNARFTMITDIDPQISDMIRIYITKMSVLSKLIETTFATTSARSVDIKFDLSFTKKIMMYYLCIAVDTFINNSHRFDSAIQSKVCKIMISFIVLMSEDKNILDYDLARVMKMVRESNIREKTIMTTKLGKMSHDERQVDNELKKNKQEGWETGTHNQRYTKYNADVANKEYEIRDAFGSLNDGDIGDAGDAGDADNGEGDDDRDIDRNDDRDDETAETDDEEYRDDGSDND